MDPKELSLQQYALNTFRVLQRLQAAMKRPICQSKKERMMGTETPNNVQKPEVVHFLRVLLSSTDDDCRSAKVMLMMMMMTNTHLTLSFASSFAIDATS